MNQFEGGLKFFFRNLKPNHIIEISSNLQYAFLVVLEAFWMAGLVFFSIFFDTISIILGFE